jgi:predicted metal-dependent peptidase
MLISESIQNVISKHKLYHHILPKFKQKIKKIKDPVLDTTKEEVINHFINHG